jgi:hypothetical protein
MEIKKALCHLWGHEFSAVPATFSSSNEGIDYICRRCGQEKFSPTIRWEKRDASVMENADIQFMRKRSEISREFR